MGGRPWAIERWRAVCEDTLDWALREMRGPEGGFFSALDADSEGEEGRFYVWTRGELLAALEAAGLGGEAQAILEHWGVTEAGNFEGRNILHLPGEPGAAAPAGLERARKLLYELRSDRVRPGLDDKRVLSWNALMVAALADAGAALGRPGYLEAAERCAEFMLEKMRDGDGHLLRTWKEGKGRLNAYLEDHAYLLEALLVLYEATLDVRWFDAARETADTMIARFADPERGGFFTTSHDHEELIARRKDADDHPIPSGNSAAAYGLLRLAALTGEATYEHHAVSVFRLLHRPPAITPRPSPTCCARSTSTWRDAREVALVAARTRRRLAAVVRVPRSARTWCSRAAPEGCRSPGADGGPHGPRRSRRPPTCASASPASGRLATRASWRRCSGTETAASARWPVDCSMAATKSPHARIRQTGRDRVLRRDQGPGRRRMAAVWEPGSLDHFYGMATLKVPEDLKAWFSSLFRAFPDFEMVVADMVAYGNKAAVRWTATGTFTGEGKFEGLTATGASVELEGLDLLTIEDGKIVENRAYTNATEMARQLGAMPPAGSAGEKAMLGMVNARTGVATLIKRARERASAS